MPALFRKNTDDVTEPAEAPVVEAPVRAKNSTPSKRELGQKTPKRRQTVRRTVQKPPADRKEAAKQLREKQRQERIERREGMLAGDERYLMARDKGPERALVRDVIDSRRTIGTWFFGLTFVVMLISFNQSLNPSVALSANLLFLLFAAATLIDSYIFCRKIKKLIQARYPKTTQRMWSLYFYAVMRGISFRFMRNPKPRVKIGAKV